MLNESDKNLFKVDELDSYAWLPTDEAAALLGVKPRQLQNRVQDGVIAKRTLPRAEGDKTARVVYSRADIEALKVEQGPDASERLSKENLKEWRSKRHMEEDIAGGVWVEKDDAAELLRVTVRSIERLAAAGRLRKQTLPREKSDTSARVFYSREDLLALKAGTPNEYGEKPTHYDNAGRYPVPIYAEGVSNDAAPQLPQTALATSPPSEFMRDLVAALAARLSQTPAVAPKAWLNLAEAAEASGLTARYLLANVDYLQALDLGAHTRGGRWRFRLDALANIGR